MKEQDKQDSANKRYYITTALDYPNAEPHIGHALEKIAADVVARYHRLLGHDTYLSMGLDENSQHVVQAARDRQVPIPAWIESMDVAFRQALAALDISYDRWMRTTEPAHVRASQEMFRRAQAAGDIYKSTYTGWFCPNCNSFYRDDELVNGACPNHPSRKPDWVEEEDYFFALSAYCDRLLSHITSHPDFIVPVSRQSEIVGIIRQGLRDFPVSRPVNRIDAQWGVPVPGDLDNVIYVWFDALTNYLTAVGFPEGGELFARYWPADAHVIGKDITRFHCLYWPAMLMSAGLPLPRQVAVHGFLTLEGKRISKTAGNVVSPLELVEAYGVDAVRFYLLRHLSFASDGDFSRAGLIQRYNDELAKDLGNLLNRVVSMIQRYRGGQIPATGEPGALELDVQRAAGEVRQQAGQALESWEIGHALNSVWSFVRRINRYLEERKPWRLAAQQEAAAELDVVLITAAESLRLAAILLAPFLPTAANRMLDQLGLDGMRSSAWYDEGTWGGRALSAVAPGPILFPRIEV
ncbi:MAG TPA: methionine--tRNA ligase [Ktedonobacteraceae bacterium]|nr:methionine--tRNA ligase [Ktedonobacteraceae bacterium]